MDALSLFKHLADPTRLYSTLLIQQQGELCVCELMVALEESQPKISRHLALLRESGLLSDSRRGQWVFYRLNTDELPPWIQQLLATTAQQQQTQLTPYLQRLALMSDRPQRCC